jgi:hypothetical protein
MRSQYQHGGTATRCKPTYLSHMAEILTPSARGTQSWLRAIFIASTCAWIVTILMSGLAAGLIFPSLKQLDPGIPSIGVVREMHWKILAGYPAQKIFNVCQSVEYVLCIVSIFAAIFAPRSQRKSAITLVRWTCHLAAAGLLIWIGAKLIAPMNELFTALRAAATAGDAARTMELDTTFGGIHAKATPAMGTMAALVAVAHVLAITEWSRRAPLPVSSSPATP